MDLKFYLFYVFNSCIISILAKNKAHEITNICYNSSLEGFRLTTQFSMAIEVSQWIDCVIACATEPCCRSINYKKTLSLQNESNCEMLHNVVYNQSETLLEKNSSYDYAYLINPPKEYNASCFQKDVKDKITAQNLESHILSSEPQEFAQKLKEWLPETGNWSICWRATRDGWGTAVFHSNCDGKVPTLTIVKVVKQNKIYVFGGYSTKSWAGSSSWTSAPGSFLFSLRNHDDLAPFKAPLIDENDITVIYRESGPSFGDDLDIGNNAGSNTFSYTDFGDTFQPPPGYIFKNIKTQSLLAGSFHFTPAEVEVLYFNYN